MHSLHLRKPLNRGRQVTLPENCSLEYSSLAIIYSLALLNGRSFASLLLLAKLSNADAMSMSARKSVDVNRSPLCKLALTLNVTKLQKL